MSVNLIARALAPAASPVSTSASAIAALRVASTTGYIQTSGYAVSGKGAGLYVSDSLASAALALAHPRFCKRSADGRYWRLIADEAGAIAVEQGGAMGDGATNDLPACRAAVAYAAAVGIRRVNFLSDAYRWWAATVDPALPLGCFLVVTESVHLEGRAGKTRIELRGTAGGSLETEVQTHSGGDWRGSAILIDGVALADYPPADPDSLIAFSARNLVIDGGGVTTRNNANAELSHKGLVVQDTTIGSIVLDHVEMRNFRGEIYYTAAFVAFDQWLNHCVFDGSDQSAFNPGRGRFWVDQCEFGNAYLAAEVLGTIGGRIQGTRFYDSGNASFNSGSLTSYAIGETPVAGFNFAYPDRDETMAPPWLDLDNCDFQNVAAVQVANFVRGKVRTTDSTVYLSPSDSGALTSTHLDIEATIDQDNIGELVYFSGPNTLTTLIPGASGSNYILPPDDVHVNLRVRRTAYAVAEGFKAAVGIRFQGYLDHKTNTVQFDEGTDAVSNITELTAPVQGMPMTSVKHGSYGYTPSLVAGALGAFALTVSSPQMGLYYYGAAGDIDVTVAAPFTPPYSYARGQRVRIEYWSELTAGTVLRFAKDGTGMRLDADRALRQNGDWIELEFNEATGKWHESYYSAQTARLLGSATYDAPSIAAGGTTTTTVTVTGAAMGDKVDGISFGVSLAGLVASGYVSAADTVTVVLFNPTGGAVDLASTTVRVEVAR